MFNYRTDLFEEATIARMVLYFLTLLKSSILNQDECINELEMLSIQEKQEIETDRKTREITLFTKLKNIYPKAIL